MPEDVTGLILAGGRSRRFGTDKALAEIESTPMVTRVYAALAPLCSSVLVSTGPSSRPYPFPYPARVVTDRTPDAGPLAGIDAGFAAADTSWLLVVACDLPFLTTTALRTLAEARSEEVDTVVAEAEGGRLQPLCACYHRRAHAVIVAQIAARELVVFALLDRLRVRTVTLPAAVLRNVNTPDDLH